MADGGRRLVTLDDLIDALDKRERAPSNVPKVETFHFKGDRVSDWLDLTEQAPVGLSAEVKLQRVLRYVLHSHRREVSKVVDAANGSWTKFGDLVQRKYRLGDGLLTMADLEAMSKEDFSTIGAFVHEFKKKARKVHGISEEAQCATFMGLLTDSEAAELTKHGEGSEKLTWATIDKRVEEGSLDQVEQHQMRLQRRKRKERDATASGTPGVKRIVTDVLAALGYDNEAEIQKRGVTVAQGRAYQERLRMMCEKAREWEANLPEVMLYGSGPEWSSGPQGYLGVATAGAGPRSGMTFRPPTSHGRVAQAAQTRSQSKATTSQGPSKAPSQAPPRKEPEPERRKEVVEVQEEEDEGDYEEDERLRQEEDRRAEQRAKKRGIQGEAEPSLRDGAPKRKKYEVRLEEGFDVERMVDKLMEGHNDLMNLKDILASPPRLRGELKGRLSRRDQPSIAMVDTGAEMKIIRERDATMLGLEVDHSDHGVLRGANCKAFFCGTASNVMVEIGRVRARTSFFVMPDVDHPILLGRSFLCRTENLVFNRHEGTMILALSDPACGNYEIIKCRNTGPGSGRNRLNLGSFTFEESEYARRRLREEQEEEGAAEVLSLSLNDVNKAMEVVAAHDMADPEAIKALREQVLESPQVGEVELIYWLPGRKGNPAMAQARTTNEEKKVVDYLDKKMRTYVANYSSGSYASPWFCFIKPNGTLRSFVKDFATKTEHLRKLVRQDQEWVWGEDQEKAVERMKGEFKEGGLVLGAPNYEATEERLFVVETDVGPTALGRGPDSGRCGWEGEAAKLRRAFERPGRERHEPRVERRRRSKRPREPAPREAELAKERRRAPAQREDEPAGAALEEDSFPACGLRAVEFWRITSEELRSPSPSPPRRELDIPGETLFRSLATHLDVSRWEASRLGEGSAGPVRYVSLEEPLDSEAEVDVRDRREPHDPRMIVEPRGQAEMEAAGIEPTPPVDPKTSEQRIDKLWGRYESQRDAARQRSRETGQADEEAGELRETGDLGFSVTRKAIERVDRSIYETAVTSFQWYSLLSNELRVRELEVEHLTTQLAEERAGSHTGEAEWEKRFGEMAVIGRGMRASPSQGAAVEAPQQVGPMGEVPLDTTEEEGGAQESLMAMSTERRGSRLHELVAAMGIGTPQERPQRLDNPEYAPRLGELRAELGSWATETGSGGPDSGRQQQQEVMSEPTAMVGSQPSGSGGDEMVVVTERPHEEGPRELDTPDFRPVSTVVREGEGVEAMEPGPQGHMGLPSCHEVTTDSMGTPSASSSQGRNKKTVRWFDTSCFWCKKEGHRVVDCPELLEDKVEGRVAEFNSKFYDKQGRIVERAPNGGRAQLYRQNQEELCE
ncbi:hypothetical protein CBR_g12115 [Chara braunii]|uniref:CCHC-type domain-containing protein n=1 Tax=Chara braunii TaxID=69332 RepID=A0A388KR58_CHABU|nr:hypothetical protein CBR_g12115 [Chara braunii]|eukprot:GBG72544.1 hypothetical protein CBR_g12115 [Chara braunii]